MFGEYVAIPDLILARSDGNSHLDEKLKRVLGQKTDHVARRIFVGGMPFSYDVRLQLVLAAMLLLH